MHSTQAEANALAASAFAAWGQTLWEFKDPDLDKTLTPEGVMPRLLENDNDAHIVRRLLAVRTSLFGRSLVPGQVGDLYLLVPPSHQSHRFRQNLSLAKRHIIEFPDVERLLLLYVQHYVAEPLFIPNPPEPQGLPPGPSEPQTNVPPTTPAPEPEDATAPQDTGQSPTRPDPNAQGIAPSVSAPGPDDQGATQSSTAVHIADQPTVIFPSPAHSSPSQDGSQTAQSTSTANPNADGEAEPPMTSFSNAQGNSQTIRRPRSQRKSKGAQEPLPDPPAN